MGVRNQYISGTIVSPSKCILYQVRRNGVWNLKRVAGTFVNRFESVFGRWYQRRRLAILLEIFHKYVVSITEFIPRSLLPVLHTFLGLITHLSRLLHWCDRLVTNKNKAGCWVWRSSVNSHAWTDMVLVRRPWGHNVITSYMKVISAYQRIALHLIHESNQYVVWFD